MADINVTINPAPSVSATVSAAPEVDVTIGEGISKHAVTHAPGGSDSLEAYYATTGSLNYVSGLLSGTGAFLTTGAADLRYVALTGNQDISGIKDFQVRPTVTDIPVLISGDPVDLVHLYAKNNQGTTIYKGQAVYVNSSNGANPLIQLASNSGESTSSKTIGLLAQNLLINEFGYVVTEGILEGFNTSAANAGDPIWLGTGGNLIYGTGNKPYGNNHLVYLGIVLRSNQNNGKVYVKVQNGFEINELHKVYAQNPVDTSTLIYNSGSGAWFARQIATGDISGISNYALKNETGEFLTTGAGDSRYALQSSTGSFITTGQTGVFYPSSNPSGFITGVDLSNYVTGQVVRPSETGNFITASQTGAFVTGSVVRPSETGLFLTTDAADVRYVGLTGDQTITGVKNFVSRLTVNGTGVLLSGEGGAATNTGELTGVFYPLNSNPSGYITGVDLSSYATQSFVTGVSGHLQGQVNTLNGQTGNYVTGSVVRPNETGNFITVSQTGQFVSTGSTGSFVTGSVVRPSETGAFLTTGAGDSRYTLQSATGSFVTTGQTGNFVTGSVVRPSETGAFLTTGAGDSRYALQSATGSFVTTGQTGQFVTGSVVRPSETGNFVTTSQTGSFAAAAQTGAFLTTGAADSRYALQSATGNFVTTGQTGQFVTGSVVRPSETGAFLTTGAADGRYALQSATGIFVTTGQTGQFVTGAVVRPNETGAFLTTGAADGRYALQSATGNFITTGQTGGFVSIIGDQSISGIKTFNSGILISATGGSDTNAFQIKNIVDPKNPSLNALMISPTSDGTRRMYFGEGDKDYFAINLENVGRFESFPPEIFPDADFTIRLNYNTNLYLSHAPSQNSAILPMMVSQEDVLPNDGYFKLLANSKNTGSGSALVIDTKYQKTGGYLFEARVTGVNRFSLDVSGNISGNGASFVQRPTVGSIGVALTGDLTGYAPKTETGAFLTTGAADSRYALQSATGNFITTAQTGQFYPTSNPSGYITGVDLSAYVTGAVVRPSETGTFLTTGAADNRYALQSATGGFITTSQTGQFVGDGETGAFLTTGAADNRYALQSATGNFITSSQTGAFAAAANTGAFLTTGSADGRYYTISNGQFISGYAITGYNDAVTGMSVTGDTTKTITLFQRDGTTVTANFADNAASGSSDTGYLTGYVSKSETGNIAVGAISLSLNGGGSTITTGYKSFTTVTFSGEILEYTILADRTGSIVIDVWKDSYGNFPLTTGDSICVSSKPTLATGIKNTDSTLTSWTKTFSAGDVFGFNVNSVSGVTNVNLTLKVKKA